MPTFTAGQRAAVRFLSARSAERHHLRRARRQAALSAAALVTALFLALIYWPG